MFHTVSIGNSIIGKGNKTYIIAEIGINHNGDVNIAKQLIDIAAFAGWDAVKFQKRTPELCVPITQRDILRDTPWGIMSYLDYRKRLEFGYDEYSEIDDYCKIKNIQWFASCWDIPSITFISKFKPVCYKIASATLTNDSLLTKFKDYDLPIILSTGMSTEEEISHAINTLNINRLLIAHSTSSYPCIPDELNLLMIKTLQTKYPYPIGYSGHEVGLQTTYAAVVLGATFIERHITLDRAMWGSDQAASIEPSGLPVACNATETLRWMVGPAGRLNDISKEGALAEQLERLADPAVRSELALLARKHAVENFSEQVVVNQMLDMYRQVMDTKE